MYKILGADGKQYGPVEVDQLRLWAAQGRVNPQTRIQPEGTTEWTTAAEVPEVAEALQAAGFAPPPIPVEKPSTAGAGAGLRIGLAATSLVFGIVSVVVFCISPFLAVPAIICGHVAHGRARRNPAEYGGRGLAIAGFILGYTSLVLFLVMLPAMLLPALARAKTRAQTITCQTHLRQLGLAFKTWALDHEDQFTFNVSTNAGGTLELRAPGADGFDRNAHLHCMVMSNQVTAPSLLVCPSGVSYLLHTGSEINETNPTLVLAWCPIHHLALLVDGSVQQLSEARLKSMLATPQRRPRPEAQP